MERLQYHLGKDPVKKLVLPFLDILLVLECKRETDSTFKGGKCKNNWHILGTKAHVANDVLCRIGRIHGFKSGIWHNELGVLKELCLML